MLLESLQGGIILSPHWKTGKGNSKKMGPTIGLVSKRVMTQSLNWQKKEKKKTLVRNL
jgi:hypothetical protein